MTWYAVHALVAMKRVDSVGPISVYENIFLVEAKDSNDAVSLGQSMAKVEADIEDDLTIDGVQAVRSFAGIRKVITISNPEPLDLDQDRPVSGTEITYSEYEVDSEDELRKLAAGEQVTVRYVD